MPSFSAKRVKEGNVATEARIKISSNIGFCAHAIGRIREGLSKTHV
jgi:hypothetical protein